MSNIFIPSYNRSNDVKTFEYFGEGNIIVPESQADDYRKKYGDNVFAIPDEKDGAIARKRNAVLDVITENGGVGWMIDDDMVSLKRKKENRRYDGEEALELLNQFEILSQDMEIMYGGFDYSGDCMKLKDFAPFSFNKPVFGCLYVNTADRLRFDERLELNEDTDMFIQKLNHSRKVLKDNRYFAEFHGLDGGKDSVIGYTREKQRKFADQLNRKWGYEVMEWKETSFRFHTKIKSV